MAIRKSRPIIPVPRVLDRRLDDAWCARSSSVVLVRARRTLRTGLAEFAYSVVEYVVGSERHLEFGVPQRGDRVLVSTLQLLSPLRGGRSVRVLADRCGQPPVRLWALGVVVNATKSGTEWLIELPGGRVLSFDQVESAAPNLAIVVLTGTAGPKLALQTPSGR